MSELSVLLILLIFAPLIIVGWFLRFSRLKKIRNKQLTGKVWLKLMAGLLGHIQQHRGLTNGYIKGSKDLKGDIVLLQSRIRRDIIDIEVVDAWVKLSDRWLSISDHWHRLTSTYEQKESENNLKEHNALIQNLLFLIDDMAQTHHLMRLNGMHLLWRELLTTTEYIGQARAIGTGLSAIGNCDSVSRIRLNYLCQKIKTQTQIIWRELKLDNSKQQSINILVNCIQEKLLQDQVSITPKEYFEIASLAINQLYEQYTNKIDQRFADSLMY